MKPTSRRKLATSRTVVNSFFSIYTSQRNITYCIVLLCSVMYERNFYFHFFLPLSMMQDQILNMHNYVGILLKQLILPLPILLTMADLTTFIKKFWA
jgi:hypothetical protein